MKSGIDRLAKEIEAAKKEGGRHVRYSDDIKQRAVALYQQGRSGTLRDFAEQIGISPAGLSKWLAREAKDVAPMPVRVLGERLPSATHASGEAIILKHRGGIVVHLPADATAALIARLVAAMAAEGRAC